MTIQCPGHCALGQDAGDRPCDDQTCVLRRDTCPCRREGEHSARGRLTYDAASRSSRAHCATS
eukprot:15454078-Alexandrium_andersonii.AAC.1